MIRIRPATPTDYKSLPTIEADAGQIFHDFGLPSIANISPSPVEYYMGLSEASAVFVACDSEDELVGFAVGLVIDGHGYLREVSVKPSFAKQGIGANLVRQIISWAKSKGFQYLTMTTFRDIPFNAPFYAKLGFHAFTPDQNWPELRKIRDQEKKNGIEQLPRLAMRLNFANL